MLRAALSPPIDAVREEIVVAPHHPDSLRRPSPRLGAIEGDRLSQTLLWKAESANGDFESQLIDATSWHAGTSAYYFWMLSGQPRHQDAGVALVERYFRSRDSLRLRSDARGHALSNVRGIGSVRWSDLAAILPLSQDSQIEMPP